jgi:hypothetical protein
MGKDMKTGTEKYGNLYWCIKTKLSEDGEIYVMADEARILPDGTLSMIQMRAGDAPRVNLAIAPGSWIACYAASLIDGAAVAVERWKGEVDRGQD